MSFLNPFMCHTGRSSEVSLINTVSVIGIGPGNTNINDNSDA